VGKKTWIPEGISLDNPNADATQADLAEPDQVLAHPAINLLDFGRPMGVLFLAVLHFVVEDERAYDAVRTFRDAVAPGGYVAISQLSFDDAPPEIVEPLHQIGARSQIVSKERAYAETLRFFEGLELVEPGLVHLPLRRPEGPDDLMLDQPERVLGWGGVGCKPY
jgi:hypothetical protein